MKFSAVVSTLLVASAAAFAPATTEVCRKGRRLVAVREGLCLYEFALDDRNNAGS